MLSMIVEQSNNEGIMYRDAGMLIAFQPCSCRRAQTRVGQFENRTVYKQEKREGSRQEVFDLQFA